jgi:drug/metabolite transporter (DMT)-like permease
VATSLLSDLVRRPPADLLLLATVSLWALNFTVSKYILQHGFRPLAYSSVRYACAGAIFAAVTLLWEGSLRTSRRNLPLVALGATVLFANQLSFVYALSFTTATTVALVFGTLPIFTGLFARIAGVEHLSRGFLLAAALSFGGVALVAIGSRGTVSGDLKGDLLALSGAATWAAYSVLVSPLMRRFSPFKLSALFLLAVTVPLVAAGSGQLAKQSFDLPPSVWLAFAFVVIGPLVVTNILWFTAIDRVGPSRAALFANLQPFLAAIVALVALSEKLTGLQVAGGLLIAGGIVVATRRRRGPPLQPPAE